MTTHRFLLASLSLLIVAGGAGAGRALADVDPYRTSDMQPITNDKPADFNGRSGEWEFSVGGAGAGNDILDDALGGANASLGYFIQENSQISVRQSVNYDGDDFSGSTYVVFDQHFGEDRLRPFVGLGLGRAYGDAIDNTWAAGLEGGLKFYLRTDNFLFAMANYVWLFDHAGDSLDHIDDGHILWAVGVGFSF